ncbi:MAG: hypothetical protein QUS08_03550, partial [Methanothrix sp.]|nr:hypothetical protein [Methanothrix sp.]
QMCIRDRCEGCGYAEVHGRCDEEDASFGLFIEAFQDLGRAIYQDTEEGCLSQDQASALIHSWLSASIDAARAMKDRLEPLSPGEFMEAKAWYLGRMISFIPSELFSDDVGRAVQTVRLRLEDYW